VANAVTFEGERRLIEAAELYANDQTKYELVKIDISRAHEMGRFTGWQPLKPVTQLRLLKS
ncbi:MAG: hypothetical protein QF503_03035, partial [Rhodospirillales bacterium]|nr:hypothetical protein [Rhodospirillales bacterium]